MDLIFGHPVRLQPYFGYRTGSRLRLSARALKADRPGFEGAGRIQAFRTMLAQFASREVPGVAVTLEIERPDGTRFSHSATSDAEGFVHFDVVLDGEWPRPARTVWEVAALHWSNRKGGQCVDAHILSPGMDTDLAVISDIDDTIIETGITGNLRAVMRNWHRVVAQWPDQRIAVPGADAFYNALGGGRPLAEGEADVGARLPATQHPFFYVSSSPWNLYSYLVAFQRSRNLPLGPIALRDWGLSRATLGHASHGAHKREAIERILADFPDLRFALIGDDTQGDLTAYGAVVERHGKRIAAVFIRTGAEAMSAEERAARAAIERAGVPLWLGDDYATGQAFLAEAGLLHDGEAEKIVEAVEDGARAAATTGATAE